MRRLAKEPKEKEKLQLYGLYKQAVHGDIPPKDDYRMFFYILYFKHCYYYCYY